MVNEGKLSLEICDEIADVKNLEALMAQMPKEQPKKFGV